MQIPEESFRQLGEWDISMPEVKIAIDRRKAETASFPILELWKLCEADYRKRLRPWMESFLPRLDI